MDLAVSARVDGSGASHDDEEGNYVGNDAAHDHVPARVHVIPDFDPLFNHGRLQVELHPGGDGSADHPDHHVEVTRLQVKAGLDGGAERLGPAGVGQETRKRIRHIEQARHQEYLLYKPVGALHDQRPDQHRP